MKADVDRFCSLEDDRLALMERERELAASWDTWRHNARIICGRLEHSQAKTRLHPYLRGTVHIPEPQNRLEEVVSAGTPISDVLSRHVQIFLFSLFIYHVYFYSRSYD